MSEIKDDMFIPDEGREKTRPEETPLLASRSDEAAERLEFVVTTAANLDMTIQGLVQMIELDEAQLAENKRTVNRLCARAGRPPRYPEAENGSGAQVGIIRADQYYGQPLAAAVRNILEGRKLAGLGSATVREIYETLLKGGFQFEAKDENAQRGLRQSLTKNSQTFHKLPNGTYGLLEWYPGAKPARPTDDADE